MKNSITDLRNHLFAALEGLSDKDAPMDIERAKAIADVAQVAINSAKVEVDYLKATGRNVDAGFLSPKADELPRPGTPRLVDGSRP